VITFWRTTGRYGCFSNFSAHPITVDGKRYATTEHFYQSRKTLDPDIQEQIRTASTSRKAKDLASETQLRAEWESIKFSIMLEALRCKANQYEFIREKLLETGEEIIAEDSPRDAIWGLGKDGKGMNLLGKAWMQVRKELQVDESKRTESSRN
jgi:N-glycosidase YbiA